MNKIAKEALTNVQLIKDLTGDSQDIIIREMMFKDNKNIYIIYCQSVADADKANDFILKSISSDIKSNRKRVDLLANFKNTIPNINFKIIDNYDDVFYLLFNGFCLIIIDGENKIIGIEVKANIDRGINEATTEPIMYGPKDSFTENFYKNVGLIRKRIKSKSLWLYEKIIGKQTKTKVGILYMEDIAEKQLVDNIKKKLDKINIDGVIDVGQIKQLLYNTDKTLFPVSIRTERPDLACLYLLEGRIVVMVDNSPIIIIIPSFLSSFLHSPDDYYEKPSNVSLTRFIRVLCFILSIVTPGYFVALLAFDREIIPTSLMISIIGQRTAIPFPAFIEAFLLIFAFEIIKESDIRIPTNIGGAVSILGALILGQAAVTAGIISPFMLIVIAISAISSLVFQSIEMTNTLRFWRFFFLISGSILGVYGILIAGLYMVVHLCGIKSFGKPFLWPLTPFTPKEAKAIILKSSLPNTIKKPDILTDDQNRQGANN